METVTRYAVCQPWRDSTRGEFLVMTWNGRETHETRAAADADMRAIKADRTSRISLAQLGIAPSELRVFPVECHVYTYAQPSPVSLIVSAPEVAPR